MTAPLTYDQQVELIAKYEKLFNSVTRMRIFQKDWEQWHASIDREKKRVWERETDKQLKQEHKERKSQQSKIF